MQSVKSPPSCQTLQWDWESRQAIICYNAHASMISELICHWAVMTKLLKESRGMTGIFTSNNVLTFLCAER